MGIYLNPDNTMFFNAALNSEVYVDKTSLISVTNKKLFGENKYLCVSRPRRFGKSMSLNMLCAYYSRGADSAELFRNFEISKDRSFSEHLNRYHVIQLNMRDMLSESDTVAEMVQRICRILIKEIKRENKEIDYLEPDNLTMVLTEYYQKTKVPFVFLIDEWDAIFRVKKNDSEQQAKYLDFLRNLLKDKPYVALAYATGILPVKKYGEHSALNMFTEYSMIEAIPLSKYTGFTTEEVGNLCVQYDIPFDEMKKWYDGYLLDGIELYNPRSVVQACLKRAFGNYWTKTETYEALKVYIEMNFDGLRDTVVELLAGGRAVVDTRSFSNDMVTFSNRDDVLSLLIHLGYLTYDSETCEVRIPNQEIMGEYATSVKVIGWSEVADALRLSDELLKATLAGDEDKVADILEKIHRSETSIMAYNDENALASVISIAYYSARKSYEIARELPGGTGFSDLSFLPRRNVPEPALVVELKVDKDAEGAIDQIKRKRYLEGLKGYQGEVLLVGINYDKKDKRHSCRIERVVKK